MEDDLSMAVTRALDRLFGHLQAVPSGDLLFEITDDPDSIASNYLLRASVNLEHFREKIKGQGELRQRRQIVLLSREVAREHADEAITGEYVVQAILRHDPILSSLAQQCGGKADILGLESIDIAPLTPTEDFTPEPSYEEIQIGRIVDVNCNRIREAFRVLDDYCRFILQDAFLTKQWKSLRHQFNDIVSHFPLNPRSLITSRETLSDVGTQISTEGEYHRYNAKQVAETNCKRLQESLRSLEEFIKVTDSHTAHSIEQLRYRTYTLEKAQHTISYSREILATALVYVLITGENCLGDIEWTIREASEGGAKIFQLREKKLSDRLLLERAQLVRKITRETNSLFIMNDRPDIAQLVEADGVHLGQDDLDVSAARKILGSRALIGVSTHSIDQLEKAILAGADYAGVGPTFSSQTKSFEEYPGLEFVRAASQLTTLPLFVIGGVNEKNISEVVKAGGKRVAVSHCVCQAEEPSKIIRELLIYLQA